MEAQEKDKQRMRESNQVMMTPSTDGLSAIQPVLNDNVTIFCQSCKEGKEVDMDVFWKQDSSNRFLKTNCVSVSCLKRRTRVGKWLRRVSDVSVTVEEWLKHKGVYTSVGMKSAAVTKEAFMAQDDMNDKYSNVENTPVKRKIPIVKSDGDNKNNVSRRILLNSQKKNNCLTMSVGMCKVPMLMSCRLLLVIRFQRQTLNWREV